MEEMAKQIVDKPFGAGDKVLKEGVKTEPCLFFVCKEAVILSTSDGKFNQKLGAGRYFGVEQLLSPKDSEKSSLDQPGTHSSSVDCHGGGKRTLLVQRLASQQSPVASG
jgi:hypothetical protein